MKGKRARAPGLGPACPFPSGPALPGYRAFLLFLLFLGFSGSCREGQKPKLGKAKA